MLLAQILAKVDFLDETMATLTEEIDRLVAPFEPMLANLDTIPGVDRKVAITLVAETGGDMSRFATAGRLCSWGGDVSRAERERGQTPIRQNAQGEPVSADGARRERRWRPSRANRTALQARYLRVKRHRGHKKAVVAVGHQILEIAYYIMRDGTRIPRTRCETTSIGGTATGRFGGMCDSLLGDLRRLFERQHR